MLCYVILCYVMYVCMDMCKNVHIQACMHAHAHMDILQLRHGVRYGWIRMDGDSFSQSRTSTSYPYTWMTINVLAYNPRPVRMETEDWQRFQWLLYIMTFVWSALKGWNVQVTVGVAHVSGLCLILERELPRVHGMTSRNCRLYTNKLLYIHR